MSDDKPNLVTSGNSQNIVVDGYPFSIEIYRLEDEKAWTFEVVDHENTSHVSDEQFLSDKDARNAALREIEEKGPLAFMKGDNVMPFSKK